MLDGLDELGVLLRLALRWIPCTVTGEHLGKGNLAVVRNVFGQGRLVVDREVRRILAPQVRDPGEALVAFVNGIARLLSRAGHRSAGNTE